jgi:probable phosphoglycerate mutase
METAEAIAARHSVSVLTAPELNELNFGEWNGTLFDELERDPRWKPFNAFRIGNRAPAGELMIEVQHRMVLFAERICLEHRDDHVALVGHGDPIKAALCHFLGLALDMYERLEIEPGSVSTIEIDEWGCRLKRLNRV